MSISDGAISHSKAILRGTWSARRTVPPMLANRPCSISVKTNRTSLAACEEYLRWVTPVQGMARTVTRDCEFGGQPLRKDDRVWISWASANLAPELFDEPEQIKLDRSPNRHSAFGLGIHRCLGSNLARVVWRIVVEQVLRRMPDYELDLNAAERYPSIGITNGWKCTPVTFTPGSKVGAEL